MALRFTYECPKKHVKKQDIHVICERCKTCNEYLILEHIDEV